MERLEGRGWPGRMGARDLGATTWARDQDEAACSLQGKCGVRVLVDVLLVVEEPASRPGVAWKMEPRHGAKLIKYVHTTAERFALGSQGTQLGS